MQWGKTDVAANSVIWGTESANKNANTANQTALFNNVTEDALVDGKTVGQFGVSAEEMMALRASNSPRPASAGWVIRSEGSGGRAGRVSYETLVATKGITGDSDGTLIPNASLSFTLQPVDATADSVLDEQAAFTSAVSVIPEGTGVNYVWEYTPDPLDQETFATTVGVLGFAGQTTNELIADANTITDGTGLRVVVSATGVTDIVSDVAVITVT